MKAADAETFSPHFNQDGLIPAIAIDHKTGAVLMMAWMNRQALACTISTKEVHYWSRSRQELWRKGATSGHVQKLVQMRVDCDQDTLLLVVDQKGAACHTGQPSCFYRSVEIGKKNLNDTSHPDDLSNNIQLKFTD